MRRRIKKLPVELMDDKAKAAASVDAFVGNKPRKKNRNASSKAIVKRKLEDIRIRMRDNKIDKVSPSEMVALFCILHTDTYGVEPTEMVGKTWEVACFNAKRFISDEFNGNSAEALLFVRWVWRRETIREANPNSPKRKMRLTWRHMFVWRDLLTDYRVEMTRRMKSHNLYGTSKPLR